MAYQKGRRKAIVEKRLALRNKLWPDLNEDRLWDRKARHGFVTLPRTMPIILNILDNLSGKGFPVSSTYLEMWCRLFDENFLTLNPQDMAFNSGFLGQRGLRTWKDRMKRLRDLGFILTKAGSAGEFSQALILNPYHVLKKHHEDGKIPEDYWLALVSRAHEIGASDLDDDLPTMPIFKQILAPPGMPMDDFDDEIPF